MMAEYYAVHNSFFLSIIYDIIFVENGSRLIGLFEFGFSASELQLQQHAESSYYSLFSNCSSRLILKYIIFPIISDGDLMLI